MARTRAPALLALILASACVDDPVAPADPDTITVEISLQGVPPLALGVEGVYAVWLIDADGRIVPAGTIADPAAGPVTLTAPIAAPAFLMITVQPPGDADSLPALSRLLGGRFGPDGVAPLGVTGYLTPVGIPLEPAPGVHVLGSVTAGVPDDAGLWLVDTRVDSTRVGYFQTFTPLTRGWAYEGWIVRDHGTPGEVWLSYGQFLPNNLRRARHRDDTGLGPFSGHVDYERARSTDVHYPGDDWAANPLALPVPGGLTLPLDLNGNAATGQASRWTHVITIEPVFEQDGNRREAAWEARPFFLRPYRNAIGEASPAVPRTIGFEPDALPRGSARIR